MKNHGVLIKLMWLVGTAVVAFVGLGLYGISNTALTFQWVNQVYQTAEDFRDGSLQITNPLNELRQLSLSIVMAPNPTFRDELIERQTLLTQQIDQTLREWKVPEDDPNEVEAFRQLEDSWGKYKALKDLTVENARLRYREEAFINAIGAEREQFREVNDRLNKWMQSRIQNAESAYQSATTQYHRVFWISWAVIMLMTLVVGSIGLIIARKIVHPIQVLKDAATRIANREPIETIDVRSRDELGDLARDMESMAAGIQSYIAQQQQAEAEVRELNAQLELRVEERTGELQTATETLLFEADERKREEERYRSLVEATTAIVWNTPASGEFETEQSEWSEFTGQSFHELKGWGWLNAVHPDDRPNTAAVWSTAVAERSLYEVEHRLRRFDGTYRHMLVRAVPILGDDKTIREWVGIHTDIDDRKRAEVMLRDAKEAAESANQAKSEFLANMSHEIRTPMNGIIGMTELTLDTRLSTEQREYLEMVKSSADYLLAVINDILDFSKIEAGKLDLDPIDFNLREHLDDTVTTLALRAHTKGLELACHVLSDVPDSLVGDPGRLRQIIVNLIGNAVKFTGEGEVVVRVEKETQSDSDVCIHFSVKDTGIGIPAEKLGLLFQAFSQVDPSTTRKFGGTGLGLAISSQLVKMMGGRIWVESEEGQGSTFHFTARFGLSTSPPARQVPQELSEIKGLRVLVVDDNATNRRILVEVLSNWGLKPTAVTCGPEALKAIEEALDQGSPFRIVLLDNMMPEMDGFMLAQEILKRPGFHPSTMMMLSSADRHENAERCRSLGLTAYMTKPVKRSELLNAILTAIESEPAETHKQSPKSHSQVDANQQSMQILLTEDNAVNQKLAVKLLEKRGHRVIVAGNGKEAIHALDQQEFDIILMDVQMPEMDGFETTQTIRKREQQTGGRIPIVAMTAFAMKGDRERCIAAGMDGYISKPLQPSELFEMVESYPIRDSAETKSPLKLSLADTDHATAANPIDAVQLEDAVSAFDHARAMETVDGDVELMKEIIKAFLEEYPKLMTEVEEAVSQADPTAIGRASHTLKGAAGALAAIQVVELAQELETMGNTEQITEAASTFATLEQAIEELANQLTAFCQN
ncbi:response regulator [Thalassoroseus pseudoceratinae]|uniref:response regulator n=1 Tax=Thalassoroseus pseudoceratinae TaxID=2713176 RepID=UPI0014245E33|nr:response regulator [Thalassoroseus pseudoceratinae]